jgi:homopolymeric O-antigen transport system permease protein
VPSREGAEVDVGSHRPGLAVLRSAERPNSSCSLADIPGVGSGPRLDGSALRGERDSDMRMNTGTSHNSGDADNEFPFVLIEPMRGGLSLGLHDLWDYRYLLYMLILRDVSVRYKQTLIGVGWAIVQPILNTAVFTMVFAYFAEVPSGGIAYPVFAFVALLPWSYFAQALGRCVTSLVGNAPLVSRVYFPRLIIPISAVAAPLVDFAAAFVVLIGLMLWCRVAVSWRVLALPYFLAVAAFTSLAVGLWLSALNVRYRDVGHAIPFLIQVAMYCSPVAYPTSLVPERWRLLYRLNPMTGVIEGFRWSLLGQEGPGGLLAIHLILVTVLLLGGLAYFRRTEATLVDVI